MGDLNGTGEIQFELPALSPHSRYLNWSSAEIPGEAGQLVFSSPGQAGLRSHIKVIIDGELLQGWSQYLQSDFDPADTWIALGPSSDLYTFLGLKATAVGLLVAAASQVFPAVESALDLYQRREK